MKTDELIGLPSPKSGRTPNARRARQSAPAAPMAAPSAIRRSYLGRIARPGGERRVHLGIAALPFAAVMVLAALTPARTRSVGAPNFRTAHIRVAKGTTAITGMEMRHVARMPHLHPGDRGGPLRDPDVGGPEVRRADGPRAGEAREARPPACRGQSCRRTRAR
jgi:hypothetical protein